MKKIYLMLSILLITAASYAQTPVQTFKGQRQLNLGVGLSNWGIPVYLGLDFGIHKDLTLGAEVSFRAYNERLQNHRYNHSVIGFSGNLNYHLNSILLIPSRWDLYAGLNIGFYHWTSADDYPGSHNSGLGLGGQVGFRYFLTSRTGLNLEFGGGNAFSGGKFGLTIKI
jgi:hypothetical protein